jgi:archaellin
VGAAAAASALAAGSGLRALLGGTAWAALLAGAIGCGGGSGGGGQRGSAVAGVAAVGAPLAGATVTVKDRSGNTVDATTGADGGYAVNLAALDAIFLVQVTSAAPAAELYSVGTQGGGIVNLTPLTDVALRAYYQAQGLDVADVFDDLDVDSTLPTASEVAALSAALRGLVAPLLEERGLDADEALAFDIFSTPFAAASGDPFDELLDDTVVTGTTYSVSGTTTQDVIITASAGSLEIESTTTGPGGSSSATTSVTVTPGQDQSALEAALAGSLTTLQQLFAAASVQAPQAVDLQPLFVTQGYLDGGRGRALSIQQLIGALAGRDLAVLAIERVLAFEAAGAGAPATGDVIQVSIRVRETAGGQTAVSVDDGSTEEAVTYALRREASGAYLLIGDQRILSTDIGNLFSLLHDDSDAATPTGSKQFTVFATAPAGAITSVDATFKLVGSAQTTVTLAKTPDGAIDTFALPGGPPKQPGTLEVGTAVTFAITPAVGSPTTITRPVASQLEETVRITHVKVGAGPLRTITELYANETVASTAGQQVTLTFERPRTFGVAENRPFGLLSGASGASDFIDATIRSLDPTATTASFNVPATVSGQTLASYGLTLDFADGSANAIHLTLSVD